MSDPESAILSALSSEEGSTIADTYAFAASHNFDHNQVVGVSKSLEGDAYVTLKELSTQFFVLQKEASDISTNGSQEVRVLNALVKAGDAGLSIPALQQEVGKDISKIGMGNCLKNKWATKDKA